VDLRDRDGVEWDPLEGGEEVRKERAARRDVEGELA